MLFCNEADRANAHTERWQNSGWCFTVNAGNGTERVVKDRYLRVIGATELFTEQSGTKGYVFNRVCMCDKRRETYYCMCQVLELTAGKLARSVLRGAGLGDEPMLTR